MDENFKEEHLEIVSKVSSEEYYVNMAKAWYFASALTKQYEASVDVITDYKLDKWTHNKTIQKCMESLAIPKERKEFLKILFSKEKILENFLNEVSNKTQLLTSKIWNSFNNKTIKKKFCDYVKKNQKNDLFSIQSLGALAEYFGVERPSLSRVLSDLVKDEKLERIGRNKYKILDKDFFEI